MRALFLALLLSLAALAEPTPYVTADGMCKAIFPAAVPDRPGGFILFYEQNLYTFALMSWNKDPQRYYEGSRTLHLIEPGVTVRDVQAGAVTGQEFHSVNSEGRHNLLREFAANGNVYEFSVYYQGDEPPAEVSQFFSSISFSSEALNPEHRPRSRVIQCSITLDGLATYILDFARQHRGEFPSHLQADQPCPAGGKYVLEHQDSGFSIYCLGHHHQEAGLPPDYPRIDHTRQIWEGPDKPLPRPDQVP